MSILELDTVPDHLVIIGGSYIALEFAQMYRRFGARVTVVEKGPRLASREDHDVSDTIKTILQNEGIDIVVDAADIRITKQDNDIEGFEVTPRAGAASIAGSHLLLAVGRRPNTDDLGLEHAGVQTDARGYITVDDQLKTSVDHIWAMGDCNGKGAFTHTSYNDFEIVAANLLDNDPRAGERPHSHLCPLHRPAAGTGRNDRRAGACVGPPCVSRSTAHDPSGSRSGKG